MRDANGKWLKGFSPNPGGGPGRLRGKGAVAFIGQQTSDGRELAEYFLRVWRGHEKGYTPAQRAEAAKWLADRYMGRAPDVSLLGDLKDEDNPLATLRSDELRTLVRAQVVTLNAQIGPAAADIDTQHPGPRAALPPANAYSDALAAPQSVAEPAPSPQVPYNPKPFSEAPRCPECNLRRAHNLDCSLRPKPSVADGLRTEPLPRP